MTRIALIAILLVGGLAAGCQPATMELAGRTFLSVGITENGAPKVLVAGTRIRLEFRDDGLNAHAGCNSMGGEYRLEGGRLVVGAMFMTEMACDEPRMAQDTWLMGVLGAKPRLVLVGDQLTIDAGAVVLTLRDRRVVEPDLAISGPTWVVESILTGDVVSSIAQGTVATLVFHVDGTLDVDTSCNTGSARWAAVGAGVEVRDLGLTKKACIGPAADLESKVVEVLRAGTIAAAIEADQLVLRAGNVGLGLRGR